ncbi:Hypothetical predicted protein [Olea europaea subsp. europaea]|uniref:Uncharacterized protein n=1 Tax=Olea europaea subsp. europaea TaxID=158383 RepID=A0A8S0SBC8_OLEEU|nr:Hypothetical predicted protein [Olea europaea subsp. europaea]
MKMLRMLSKTATIMGSFSSVEEEAYDVVDDLSSWEFVDLSFSEDDEQEDLCSLTDDEMTSKNGKEEEDQEEGSESLGDVISVESLSVSPPQLTLTTADVCCDDHDQEEEAHDDDEEDMDDEDGFGLDDELVPWMLKDRFGRQRIRKMGKRGSSRVNKSKRGPYFYNRPGAVYGKHGLGVQHSFI